MGAQDVKEAVCVVPSTVLPGEYGGGQGPSCGVGVEEADADEAPVALDDDVGLMARRVGVAVELARLDVGLGCGAAATLAPIGPSLTQGAEGRRVAAGLGQDMAP